MIKRSIDADVNLCYVYKSKLNLMTLSTYFECSHLQRADPAPCVSALSPDTLAYPPPDHRKNILSTTFLFQFSSQRFEDFEFGCRDYVCSILWIAAPTNEAREGGSGFEQRGQNSAADTWIQYNINAGFWKGIETSVCRIIGGNIWRGFGRPVGVDQGIDESESSERVFFHGDSLHVCGDISEHGGLLTVEESGKKSRVGCFGLCAFGVGANGFSLRERDFLLWWPAKDSRRCLQCLHLSRSPERGSSCSVRGGASP